MVFQAKEKKTEKSPDYVIKAKIKGEFRDIGSGWKKISSVGTTFLSLSIVNDRLRELIQESETTSAGKPLPSFEQIVAKDF